MAQQFPTFVRWSTSGSRDLAIGGASVAYSNPSGGQVRMLRLKVKDGDARISIGVAAVATSTDTLMTAGDVEYVEVAPGEDIAVIQDTTAGTLNITDCTK